MGTVGTGITLTFGTSGFSCELLSVDGPNMSRKSIDMSHHGTTVAMVFSPGDLYDAGQLDVTVAFKPSSFPPIDQAAEEITVAYPDSAASSWAFEGFMTGFQPKGPLEERLTASFTIKASGEVS